MTQQGSADRREHDLGRRRGDPRDVHAGRLRLPRGGADADEERRPHRRQERPHLRRLLDRLLRSSASGSRSATAATASSAARASSPGRRPARDRRIAVQLVLDDPRRCGLPVRGRLRGVSLAIVWGAMAERAKLWVYFAFGVVFTLIYSVVSHWIWHPDGWLFAMGMQDFAGSTVVHYQGALAALAGALLLGPRIGKFGRRRQAERDPRPQHAVRRPRDDHPLVRLVRLQPGLDARRRHRRQDRLLRLRRADDEPRGRGRRARRRWSPRGSCSRSPTSR